MGHGATYTDFIKFNINDDLKYCTGIYRIVNTTNGKVYIGKTLNFYKRFYQHRYAYNAGISKCINDYLRNSISKYGIESFVFEIVEITTVEALAERELFWMLEYKSTDRNYGYNLRLDSSTGMVTHELTRKKISERLRKEWRDGKRSAHRDKMTKYLFAIYDEDRYLSQILNLSELKESLFSRCLSRIGKKDVKFVSLGNSAYIEKILPEEAEKLLQDTREEVIF